MLRNRKFVLPDCADMIQVRFALRDMKPANCDTQT